MALDPPKVLLDLSFLQALTDTADANHDAAVSCYSGLVDDFQADRRLLIALTPHLRQVDPGRAHRFTLLAPVWSMVPAGQHRRAARRASGVPADLALAMVMMTWNRLTSVASFDQRWQDYDVDVLPAAPAVQSSPA